MKLRILTTALVALAGAFITQSAKAQLTPAVGDLILSFQQSGSPNDLEVDLGSISLFTAATPSFSINLGTDITNQFGGVTNNLQWNVLGGNDTLSSVTLGGITYVKHDVFVSDPTSTPLGTFSTSGLSSPSTVVSEIYAPSSSTASGNATNAFIVPASGGTNAFSQLIAGTEYGVFSASVLSLGASSANLDIEIPSSSTLLSNGTFTLSSAGVFTYGAAIPEPSTYALMLVGALLLLVQINRRKSPASL